MKRIVVICIVTLCLAGCAAPASVNGMIGMATKQLPADSPLKQNMQVVNVSGGQSTSPLWTSEIGTPEFQQALRQSLVANGLSGNENSRFRLDAMLMQVSQPLIGFDMTVTSTVRYIVTDSTMNRSGFDQTISASYTAKVSDAFLGVERLKLANEGSIKTNISQFLDKLYQGNVTGGMPMASLRLNTKR